MGATGTMNDGRGPPRRVVIVGAGQAAVSAIETLRANGYSGSITVVGEEAMLPYQRPPLSKGFLIGDIDAGRLLLRPAQFYDDNDVRCVLGVPATEIDRASRELKVRSGEVIPYDALLLSTGGRARQLGLPLSQVAAERVHQLRSVTDAYRLRQSLKDAAHVAIVGGGYIGLEVASACRKMGLDVTLLQISERVLRRVTSAVVSSFYRQEHERQGVRILCNTSIREVLADRKRGPLTLKCAGGVDISADQALLCVGLEPVDALAREAGLLCSDGVVVDEACRTSDPAIFAAGDCANQFRHRYQCSVRLESVDNACVQGRVAALSMLGLQAPQDAVPSFWSDQYDLNLVSVGLCRSYDDLLIRGSPTERRFSVCYLREGRLVGIDSINAPRDQMAARKLIESFARPDMQKLRDCAVPLKHCV